MKINTSQISMDASAEHKDVTGKFAQIEGGKREGDPEFQLRIPGVAGFVRERVSANRQGQEVCAASSVRCQEGEKNYETSADQVLEKMISKVSGQRIRLRKITGMGSGVNVLLSEPVNPPGKQVLFSLLAQTTQYEYERVSVRSTGSVSLADGREIDFSLELNMERESFVQESVALQGGGILMDPLAFSFDCDLRSLINKTFQFDMNCDGETDELSTLAPGMGFLALDLNDDKKINDGSELFGPATGHGFSELAAYDLDNNGWIDENDPVFSKLRVWEPGGTETTLIPLAEAGVGAICLSHDTNSFQVKDMDNQLLGEVAATGLFLTEDGEVRPMQEIKLALQGTAERDEDQREPDPQFFVRQMIAVRQEEVRTLARLRLSRQEEEEQTLLEILFPDWQKEKGLLSVEQRRDIGFMS